MTKKIMFSLFLLCGGFFLFFQGCSSMIETITDSMTNDMGEQDSSSDTAADEEMTTDATKVPENQEIIGTWINKDYDTDGRSAKLVYTMNADKTYSYKAYDKADGSGKVYLGKVTYSKRWFDANGNLLGESNVTLEGGMSWSTLDRISADGKTLEVQSGVTKINPKGPQYSIYYRK